MTLHVGISCDVDGCESRALLVGVIDYRPGKLRGSILIDTAKTAPPGWHVHTGGAFGGGAFECWRHRDDADTVLGEIVTGAVHERAADVAVAQTIRGERALIAVRPKPDGERIPWAASFPLVLAHEMHGRGTFVPHVLACMGLDS